MPYMKRFHLGDTVQFDNVTATVIAVCEDDYYLLGWKTLPTTSEYWKLESKSDLDTNEHIETIDNIIIEYRYAWYVRSDEIELKTIDMKDKTSTSCSVCSNLNGERCDNCQPSNHSNTIVESKSDNMWVFYFFQKVPVIKLFTSWEKARIYACNFIKDNKMHEILTKKASDGFLNLLDAGNYAGAFEIYKVTCANDIHITINCVAVNE